MSTFDDLEEYKNELTEEEYNEEKSGAEVQLKEFEAYLAKNAAGNDALTNTINAQLEKRKKDLGFMQSIISSGAEHNTKILRENLEKIAYAYNSKKQLSEGEFNAQSMAIILKLEQTAGVDLTDKERSLKNQI